LLLLHEQEVIRHQVAHNVQKLYKKYNVRQASVTPKKEIKTVKQIKKKLADAEAIVIEADKGSSMTIIYENEYSSKVHDFINNNYPTSTSRPHQENYNATSGQPSTTA
jgi:hypothetical protein